MDIRYEAVNKPNKIALILGVFTILGPMAISMYLPALPEITTDLGTASVFTQLSFTATLIGVALGQLWIGSISDRKGRRKPLLFSLSFYALISLFCALSPSILFLIIFKFLQGLAGGGSVVLALSVARDLYEGPMLTKTISLLLLIVSAGPILSPLIAGQILLITSWRGVFIFLCLVGIMSLLMAFKFNETSNEYQQIEETVLQSFNKLLKIRQLVGYAFIQGFMGGAFFTYVSGSSFIIQNVFSFSPQIYSLLFSMNAIGVMAMNQIAGHLSYKFNENIILNRGIGLALIGGIILLLSVLFQLGTLIFFIGLFISAASMGLVYPTTLSLALQNYKQHSGSVSAILGAFQFIFGGIIASIFGIFKGNILLNFTIVILGCYFMVFLSYYFFIHKQNQLLKEDG